MTLPSFRGFLEESAPTGKLTHLQHLEDLVLDEGVPGLALAEEVLREFHVMLRDGGVSRSMNVRTKWDGAPSVVFGHDPADGQFFVATKAAFSKTPKLMKTHDQIVAAYGDSGVANKLHTCLSELALLRPKHIFQGDLIFTDDVREQHIDGTDYLTFRPNTILYAVDKHSEFGQRIARAQLGIVLHSMYEGHGNSFANYHVVSTSPMAFASLAHSSRVVAIDNTFDDLSGTVTFTDTEETDFVLAMHRIREIAGKVPASTISLFSTKPLHPLIQQFLNARVRSGALAGSGSRALQELVSFLTDRRDKEISERKTPEGQDRIRAQFDGWLRDLMQHKDHAEMWFNLHAALNTAKILVLRKLTQAKNVATFVPTPEGLRATSHEGFVATSHSGRMVKLVDRLEFSRNNFLVPKQWA